MAKKKTWPSAAQVLANVKRGIIDDRTTALSPFDLTEDEILAGVDALAAKLETQEAQVYSCAGANGPPASAERAVDYTPGGGTTPWS
jgi:hypothetical protein